VHIVHTLAFGSGRTPAGLARIAYVFGSSQWLQGLESGSSPTSGTRYPSSEGFSLLMCVHWPYAGPSDTGRGLCLAPRPDPPPGGVWGNFGPPWVLSESLGGPRVPCHHARVDVVEVHEHRGADADCLNWGRGSLSVGHPLGATG